MRSNKQERVGEINKNKQGDTMTIIEYINATNMKIEFSTGEIISCHYKEFKNGSITSHFYPSVYGVGIRGIDNGEEHEKLYDYWHSMLRRCYDERSLIKNPTYKGCKVCDEWLYFSKFKEWFVDNYYEIEGCISCLDKDILVKGNKIYSPDTCVFAPRLINSLFVKNDVNRGELPLGVQYNVNKTRYVAMCKMGNRKEKRLGTFDTPIEAFNTYKIFKENHIKQVADKYKDHIPQKLYDAMYRYEVEITD